jgi:Cu(I)/Ag(I) efflux system membrane fusion protein
MKRSQFLMCFAVLLVGVFTGLAWYHQQGAATNGAKVGRQIPELAESKPPSHHPDNLETVAGDTPMGPGTTEDQPAAKADPRGSRPPGTVQVSPHMQQIMGVQIEKVEMAPQSYTLRTLGRVAADETRVYPVLAATSGWIWEAGQFTTGSLVQKDQLLASYYSRDFFSAEQSYFSSLDYVDRLRQQPQNQLIATEEPGEATRTGVRTPLRSSSSAKGAYKYTEDQTLAAKQQLFDLGMGETQIKELERTREFTVDIQMRAPATGFLLARSIYPGQRFERGAEFFRIVDLSRVWILADVFEREAQLIQPGLVAKVRLPQQEKVLDASVSNVLQLFDEATRTFKVRLEVDNPDYLLRPNMFTDVDFSVQLPPAITVSADAVLDSGMKKTVFVALGDGFFEPRRVATGRRLGDRIEIVEGLKPGESIVVAGNFLIDSESRMNLAVAGMQGGSGKPPASGAAASAAQHDHPRHGAHSPH